MSARKPARRPRLINAEGALDDAALRRFVETRGAATRRARPDLFLSKMRRSASAEFPFFRGMPDVFYDMLRRSPHAARLAASPEVFLAGDVHAENAEIVDHKGLPLPQLNDFDDCGTGPAALDQARLLVGAAFIGNGAMASRADLIEEARRGYLDGLRRAFGDWRRSVAEEAAVEEGPVFERRWRRHGRPLTNGAFCERLLRLVGLDESKYIVLDRAGSGLSSIGVLRYLFAHETRPHCRELKQTRAPATAVFTGRHPGGESARVAKGYETLRRVPVETRAVRGLGSEWLLRRREGTQRSLALEHAQSAARVLGGLAAQAHRKQAATTDLAASIKALDADTLLCWVHGMAAMRAGLARLLDSGIWDVRRRR